MSNVRESLVGTIDHLVIEKIETSNVYNSFRNGIHAWEKTKEYSLDFKSVAYDQPLEAIFGAMQAVGAGISFGAITPLLYGLINSSSLAEVGMYSVASGVCLGIGTELLGNAMDIAHIAERRIYTTFPRK
ncbi:hypothetical protein HN385_05115 [archaeon]|jgi:hypothetical protein|nr:hypothetical protein [archaeon]MBT3465073.1 hypothetical protein [archaeon]MBT6869254.1 hypothetical protein [archaeon]MBT7193652.1 hypothetical protein [archaeon]MBT7380270.1 hypothetical protein [archaeon]